VEHKFGSPLISTTWLAANLHAPDLRIVDCTGIAGKNAANCGRVEHYDRHHIPGASYLDVADPRGSLSDPHGRLPYTWPDPEQFARAMSSLGIGNEHRVVLYSAPNPMVPGSGISWATRAWWIMHHYGVDCAVLDGGLLKWINEGNPVSTVEPGHAPTEFAIAGGWRRGLAQKEDVLRAISDTQSVIVDSLSRESYLGRIDPNYGTFGSRKGHICNSVNVHFADLIDHDGCFLDRKLMSARFIGEGVSSSQAVIAYCGGGIGATVVGIALKCLGYPRVAIYDDSLMEWSNDASLPMADPSLLDCDL